VALTPTFTVTKEVTPAVPALVPVAGKYELDSCATHQLTVTVPCAGAAGAVNGKLTMGTKSIIVGDPVVRLQLDTAGGSCVNYSTFASEESTDACSSGAADFDSVVGTGDNCGIAGCNSQVELRYTATNECGDTTESGDFAYTLQPVQSP
jgi:hypothetical protein